MSCADASAAARPVRAALALAALASALAPSAHAAMSAEELAKLAQNPVGNLVSVPFQNNTNFNTGPLSGTQNILNIQPVIPIEVNQDWNTARALQTRPCAMSARARQRPALTRPR